MSHAAIGLDVSLYGMGVAVGDYDGDGFVDVFISAVGTSRLFRNLSGGKFADVTDQAGVAGTDDDWGTSCGWFDYDNDGDLDLFVCNYVAWSKEYDLAQNFQLIGGGPSVWPAAALRGHVFLSVPQRRRRQVHRCLGEAPAFRSSIATPACRSARRWAWRLPISTATAGSTWLWPTTRCRTFCFTTSGDGTFREIGQLAGVAYDTNGMARGAMGIDIAAFPQQRRRRHRHRQLRQRDDARLYVSRSESRCGSRTTRCPTALGRRRGWSSSSACFFSMPIWMGGSICLQANGHLEEDIQQGASDAALRATAAAFLELRGRAHDRVPAVCEPKSAASDFVRPMVGRGAAYADIDGDGDLDLVAHGFRRPAAAAAQRSTTWPSLAAGEARRQSARIAMRSARASSCTAGDTFSGGWSAQLAAICHSASCR